MRKRLPIFAVLVVLTVVLAVSLAGCQTLIENAEDAKTLIAEGAANTLALENLENPAYYYTYSRQTASGAQTGAGVNKYNQTKVTFQNNGLDKIYYKAENTQYSPENTKKTYEISEGWWHSMKETAESPESTQILARKARIDAFDIAGDTETKNDGESTKENAGYQVLGDLNAFFAANPGFKLESNMGMFSSIWKNTEQYEVLTDKSFSQGNLSYVYIKFDAEKNADMAALGLIELEFLTVSTAFSEEKTTYLTKISNALEDNMTEDGRNYPPAFNAVTLTVYNSGPSIGGIGGDPAATWADKINNPVTAEADNTLIIIIGVAGGVLVLLILAFIARRRVVKKRYADYLAKKEAKEEKTVAK